MKGYDAAAWHFENQEPPDDEEPPEDFDPDDFDESLLEDD